MYLTYKSVYLSLNTSTAQCCTPLFELKNPENPEKPMTFVHACSKQLYFEKRIWIWSTCKMFINVLKNESGDGARVNIHQCF